MALAVLQEDLGSIPSTNIMAHNSLQLQSPSTGLLENLHSVQTYVPGRPTKEKHFKIEGHAIEQTPISN